MLGLILVGASQTGDTPVDVFVFGASLWVIMPTPPKTYTSRIRLTDGPTDYRELLSNRPTGESSTSISPTTGVLFNFLEIFERVNTPPEGPRFQARQLSS